MSLLTQNSELKDDHIWNWTLPAYRFRRHNQEMFNACPNAGACKDFCYARNGTYLFPEVKRKHKANFELTQNPRSFIYRMCQDIYSKEKIVAVRIHDAGDFYSEEYLDTWIAIAKIFPKLTFYAYTKQVEMFKNKAHQIPDNFLYIFSCGGLQDHLIDKNVDRHAEVFPDEQALAAAGYFDQSESDLLAVTADTNKIGIPANNIRHYLKKMADKTFSELQDER